MRDIKMTLTRFKDGADWTLGRLAVRASDNARSLLELYTLEPAGADTTARGLDRRIPCGAYSVGWHNSPRFKARLPLIWGAQVPRDRYILIHAGNYGKDTEGCILVGMTYAKNGAVLNSKKALSLLLPLLQGANITLEIRSEI